MATDRSNDIAAPPDYEMTIDEDGKDMTRHVSQVEEGGVVANSNKPNPKKEAPLYVAGLSPEERERAEKKLVRKIDFRLLPIVIVMYILNYLDRNNIAAARLAGLEDDLGLTSVQYQVCSFLVYLFLLLIQY